MWDTSLAQLGGNAPYCTYRPSTLSVAVFAVQNDDLRLSHSTEGRRGEKVWRYTGHLRCHLYLKVGVPAPALSRALLDYAVSSVNSVNFRGNSSAASRRARHSWLTLVLAASVGR